MKPLVEWPRSEWRGKYRPFFELLIETADLYGQQPCGAGFVEVVNVKL